VVKKPTACPGLRIFENIELSRAVGEWADPQDNVFALLVQEPRPGVLKLLANSIEFEVGELGERTV